MQRLHDSRFSSCAARVVPWRALALSAALLLAACTQNAPKADALEAQSDAFMAGQAYLPAINALQKAVKYDSNEPRRWVKLGRAQRAAGMPALAAMSFQHALDLDPANVESLQNLSILEVRAGRYDEAKTYVDPLMVLSPDDVAGVRALGAIALYKKQLPEGLVYADKLIRIAPQSLGGYSLKAHILDAMGRPAEAAKVLAQQALFNPDDKELALQLLQLYQKAGDVQGVRDTSIALARLIPDDPRYQLETARAAYAAEDAKKADAIIGTLLNRYLYLPEVALAAAQLWQAQLPAADANARITALMQRAKGRTKGAIANVLIASGQSKTVLAALAALEKANPGNDNVDAMAAYANALLIAGQLDRAKAVSDAVLNFDSRIDAALIVRAKVELIRKKYADALTDAQLAASDNNQNVEAAILIPRIYAAWGKKLLAANAWGDASMHLPDSIDVLRARMQWLNANGEADIAKSLAATFAAAHKSQSAAWELYRQSCVATGDDYCAAEAAANMKTQQKRGR